MPKISAYGKRKPSKTYVGCRGCHKLYLLDDKNKCPNCGVEYNKFKGFPGDKERWW